MIQQLKLFPVQSEKNWSLDSRVHVTSQVHPLYICKPNSKEGRDRYASKDLTNNYKKKKKRYPLLAFMCT